MPATLNTYLTDAMRLLREQRQDLVNPEDLRVYINRARREVAMRSQCMRILTPIAGACSTASIINPGSGYVSGSVSVTISGPDFPSGLAPTPGGAQATATVVLSGSSIAAVNIIYGGDGYFQPLAGIVSSAGSGASVTIQTSSINVFNANQEVYPFSGINVSTFPGFGSVYMVLGISVIYANYRYSLPVYPFSVYQALIRQYPFQYTYVPTFASQIWNGTSGKLYVYPLPSQTYQYELDCFCLPQDLLTNFSVEALPDPWTDAVSFYTCYYAMMSLQNYNAASFYMTQFDNFAQRYSNYSRPGRGINSYGRY
jgi:hypothetical protein